MTDKKPTDGQPVPRKKYMPAFKAECARQAAAGAYQSDVARAQDSSSALLGRWQRVVLEQAVPGSTEREEIKRLRAELKRVELERGSLKKAVTSACFKRRLARPQSWASMSLSAHRPTPGRLRTCAGR